MFHYPKITIRHQTNGYDVYLISGSCYCQRPSLSTFLTDTNKMNGGKLSCEHDITWTKGFGNVLYEFSGKIFNSMNIQRRHTYSFNITNVIIYDWH